jgi:formylglycine-generating enzyme required for sulfatase activity
MSEEKRQPIAPAAFEPLAEVSGTPRRGLPRYWWLYALIGLFAIALLFLLTARSLEVRVVADSEPELTLSGFALPFGGRYLLRPGEYRLTVNAEGYRPYEELLTVDDAASQRVEVILQPLPGRLTVHSEPSGAEVLIDGELLGRTPLADAPVEAGEHRLQLRAPRYLPLEQTLDVTGRQVQQRLDLALDPAWADVSISSQPAGADILVDGETAGQTPATVEILQGEHAVALRLNGYADWTQTLSVSPGERLTLDPVALVPAAGVISVTSSPSGANVNLDGEFAGQTPLEIEISPDREHRLTLSRAGYQRRSATVSLAAGARAERSFPLEPLLGDVVLRVEPPQAEVFVNGRAVGTGSRTLALPAVQQRIELRLEGYESVRRTVTPRPGLEQLLEITLLTPQEARKARLKPTITTALGQTLQLIIPAEEPRNEFSMGASRRDPGRRANEVLHPVRLERPFYIQSTEVTNAQFRQFQSSHNSGQLEGNSLNREHQPAAQVSWQQAAAFCNWLSRREGLTPFYQEQQGIIVGFSPQSLGYRLPTEAEWAFVARVDGEEPLRRFTWGEAFPPDRVMENVADNSSAYVTGRILNGYEDGYVVSAPVGSFEPNHRGLFDIGGNVSEWIHDVYTIPASSGVVVTDPLGAQRGDNYVIRGASWALGRLPELRLSYRDYGQAGRDDVGFRIARYAE